MILSDIETINGPDYSVNVISSKRMYTVSVTHGSHEVGSWKVLMDEIGYIRPPKRFIKFVKRKDGAPTSFFKRILNYIKQ